MVPPICSNNMCGSYNRDGIKQICVKCFLKSLKESVNKFERKKDMFWRDSTNMKVNIK